MSVNSSFNSGSINNNNNNTYDHLISHISDFLITNKIKNYTIEKLIKDEYDNHFKIYEFLLFEFSEVVGKMVKKYLPNNHDAKDYSSSCGGKFHLTDNELLKMVYKIATIEYKITSIVEEEFVECFMETPDLIVFTIKFVSKTVKFHNVSSFCDSFDSSSTTLTNTAFST
ncbi:hypothetical protein RB653_003791 [Dictyostelium firmibasis]|uniref:Uncharacterized protein n=1 Tax=Dictyostelium firmibasis TaxID=79012 RepID=A0AAN7U8M5_9MYCE